MPRGTRPYPWNYPSPLPTEDHLDVFIGRLAQEWINDCDNAEPFYLQVNFGGHMTPGTHPLSISLYNPDDMPLSIRDQRTGPLSSQVELLLKHAPNKLNKMGVAQNQLLKANYYSKVTLIDDCVGGILQTLEERNLLDNTWIVFSSDHGEMLGDHGLLAKKVFYEGAVKVPCLFRSPNGRGQGTAQALTCHLDIVATLIVSASQTTSGQRRPVSSANS